MKEYENEEGKPHQITTQTNTRPEVTGQAREGEAVNSPLVFLIKQEVVDKLDPAEPADKRAFQILETMSQLQYLIGMRQYKTGQDKEISEKMAPFKKSLQKIEMAYEIIAYPLLEEIDGLRISEAVRDAQEHPNKNLEEYPHRAPFELNDEERGILGALARTTDVPHDPKKRVYSYTELIARLDARNKATMDSYKARMIQQRMIDEGILRKRSDIEREIRKRQMSYVPSKTKPSGPKK
jgi:hypothetical protein